MAEEAVESADFCAENITEEDIVSQADKETENITEEDIVSLANKETGEFEIDFCFEGGLHNTNWETCTKNSGHTDFFPIDEFTIDKLPDNVRDKDTYGLIKALSELTVHITVGYASPDRPSKVNDKDYPCFSAKNRWTPRYGSGRVWGAEKVENEPCQCSDCKTSDNPIKQWAKISILTAMHVIFDQSEAEKSKFKLGFNKDGDNYKTLEGYKAFKCDLKEDMCYLYSASHRVDLVDELKKHLEEFEEKCRVVNAKYKKTDNVKLTAIVSHPHGYFKRVTVGNWEVQEPQKNKSTRYEYTTATCKGSSGAPVFVFGKEKGWWLTHHHSGCDKNTKFNYSGIIWL
ncbi:uncharacterized protein LOC131949986 isoform X2 [Physella acuta]|nr:uncharacterized protein LOC131949986 isoform X2 [Physella acuta]XP_059167975.1 uncharacterized protein LOC131949986 isoform X2 [Physella acuta]XP_059167983.1 uncharacterized protein LOC131949986 isoform X2 [Physella acuta]XP_059167993.1 uncharacterized protein LOC131949986 isoform X2 [Physella acuta]XP_059168001.1 uncharacterized protein LOC131949986 isoform X2 [Physella acuta]